MEILHFSIAALAQEGADERAARLACLDTLERERYEQGGQAGQQFLLTRSQVKRELALRCGLEPAQIHLSYNEHGKPHCAQAVAQQLHFNISHAQDQLLIALHDSPLGIDLEQRRPRRESQLAAIAKRFMPEAQRARFVQDHCPLDEFYDCWCASEAIIKLWGKSIWQAKQIPHYLYRDGELHFGQNDEERGFQLKLFQPCKNYSAAIACHVFRLPAPSI